MLRAVIDTGTRRAGARVVGVDPTPAQLDTARRVQAEFGLDFPLVEAFAEDVPLPDASFDLARGRDHRTAAATSTRSESPSYYSFVTPDWARKWPAEIWAARKQG